MFKTIRDMLIASIYGQEISASINRLPVSLLVSDYYITSACSTIQSAASDLPQPESEKSASFIFANPEFRNFGIDVSASDTAPQGTAVAILQSPVEDIKTCPHCGQLIVPGLQRNRPR